MECGERLGTLEAAKMTGEIAAPVGGVVLQRNGQAIADPYSVNRDPFGAGWLVALEPTDWEADSAALVSGPAVKGWVRLRLHRPVAKLRHQLFRQLHLLRPGVSERKSFIRVDWPLYPTALVAEKIAAREAEATVGRVCLSQVQHPRAYEDLLLICGEIHSQAPAVPLSALVSATTLDEERLHRVREQGVDMIGVGLDAATPELFRETRGRGARGPHSWEQHWAIVRAAREIFGPCKVNCHLMVGLGETGRELVEMFYNLKSHQIAGYLFSFNPEPDTAMKDVPRAPMRRWRRVQLVKHLIEVCDPPAGAIEFDAEGAIGHIDAPADTMQGAIAAGQPFMTDGCPDRHGEMACNRPYGSYRPGEPFRDYPFWPAGEDIATIRRQLEPGPHTPSPPGG